MNKVLRIIHFINDEKFIDGIIEMWNSFSECENHYFIYKPFGRTDIKLKYIRQKEYVEIINTSILRRYLNVQNDLCDVVVLHKLSVLPPYFISKIDNHIKVVWFSWGDDIYDKSLVSTKN